MAEDTYSCHYILYDNFRESCSPLANSSGPSLPFNIARYLNQFGFQLWVGGSLWFIVEMELDDIQSLSDSFSYLNSPEKKRQKMEEKASDQDR